MTPGEPDPERMMRANCRVCSCNAEDPTEMEAVQGSLKQEETHSPVVDHLQSEEHLAREDRSIHPEKMVTESQETLNDVIAGI